MAQSHEFYDDGFLALHDCSVNWADDNIAAVLLEDSYTKDLSGDSTYSDISSHEADDSDYSPVSISNKTITLSSDGDNVEYSSDDIVFVNEGTIKGRYIVFVAGDASNLSSSDKLISIHDLGEAKASTDSEFRLNLPSDGYWFRSSKS